MILFFIRFLEKILRFLDGYEKTLGIPRSGHWRTFESHYWITHPKVCAVCDSTKDVELHHIKSFHEHPEDECKEDNVIPLCESDPLFNCHRIVGHLKNFRQINPNVVEDARICRQKFIDAREALKK